MIVRMNKVTLICVASDRDATLECLRDLGVLHLAPVEPPGGSDLETARRKLERARHALAVLNSADTAEQGPQPTDRVAPHPAPAELVAVVIEATTRRRERQEKLDALARERDALEPFGDFDPAAVRALAGRGVQVTLHHTASRQPPAAPAGAALFVLRQDNGGTWYALVALGPVPDLPPAFPLPERALSAVLAEARDTEVELAGIESRLQALRPYRQELAAHVDELYDALRYQEARTGMATTDALACLQGFCPVAATPRLRDAATRHGWGLLVAAPDPSDNVPTLLHMPGWVRPMEALCGLIKILPGYREVDVSASFLIFLSIFFAMIVGDAGYGLVFLLVTAFAHCKLRAKAPPGPFVLMYIFAVCTIVWGILTGTYFGVTGGQLPVWVKRVEWLGDDRHVMGLCLLIGSIHLTVAHGWNVFRFLNSLLALAQLGWIGITWTMYFAAKTMLLGAPFPGWVGIMAAASLVAVVLFMIPLAKLKTEWVNHAMLPLAVMSSFGDVLSYLRLFALGVAGVQLAAAFNQIALSIGFGSVISGLIAALVLFLGHALNIVLCAMSVLVHGIRLNALEFSMHMGLEWSGSPFRPFARTTPQPAAPHADQTT